MTLKQDVNNEEKMNKFKQAVETLKQKDDEDAWKMLQCLNIEGD